MQYNLLNSAKEECELLGSKVKLEEALGFLGLERQI
jgi:hypothetical protein